jgi:hypothetical protein
VRIFAIFRYFYNILIVKRLLFYNLKTAPNLSFWLGFTLESQCLYVRIAVPLRWNRNAIRLLSQPDFMVSGPKIDLKAPLLTLQSLRGHSGWCAPQVLKSCYKSLHLQPHRDVLFYSRIKVLKFRIQILRFE